VFSGMTGESQCFDQTDFGHAPCINLDKTVKEDGNTKRLNLTYHATDDVMLYATWSEGFRPGGINRRGTIPPYKADFITNYEFGFKTTFANNRVRINGAIFQDDWDNFQYSFLGANGLTEIRNAGQARIKGIETDMVWAVTDRFTLSSSMSWIDAHTTLDYCGETYTGTSDAVTNCSDPAAPSGTITQAPSGQDLPVQPSFKGNAVGRYEFPLGSQRAHLQGSWVYQSSAWSDLRTAERELLGKQPAYNIFYRWIEEEDVIDACERNGLGIIAFSPLAQGLLTDRYLHGIPEDSRASRNDSLSRDRLGEETIAKIRALNELAEHRGQSLAQLALAWVLRDERMTSALIGASSVEQLDDSLGALDNLALSDDELAEIDRYAVDGAINIWAASSER